jgi:hypothetical protein
VYETEKFDKQRFKKKIPPGWAQVIVKQKKKLVSIREKKASLFKNRSSKTKNSKIFYA